MLLFIRIFLILYGLIAAATGLMGTRAKYNASITDAMTDNNHRYLAAIWMATSLAFFYVAWKPTETALFRFLMIALFIGGIVRAIALINYSPTPIIWAVIILELVPTPLLWYLHSKLLNSGSL